VVDPGGAVTPDAVVLIQGDHIRAVGPAAQVKVPEGARRVAVPGKWIVPGLVDAHVHFFQSGGLYTRPDAFDLRGTRTYAEEQRRLKADLDATFARTLHCGVTAVADLGGPFWNFEVRDLAARSPRAPRVAVTGPLISTVSREALDLGDPPIVRCTSPEEARALVRREAEKRPDFIKIWYVVTAQEPVEKGRPVVEATVAEAHRLGLRVAVHATQLQAAKNALEAGADILVHSVDDAEVDEAFLRLAKARNALYIPTLIVSENYLRVATGRLALSQEELAWGDPFVTGTLFDLAHLPEASLSPRLKRLREQPPALPDGDLLARNLLKVHRAGIAVALGTDAGNIGTLHGASVFPELARMEAAGLTPLEVLRSATLGGARVLGREKELGRVAPGFLADLLILDADPLASTRNLSKLHRIFRGGEQLEPAAILPDGPEALAQRQLNAYNARDLEAFLRPYAPDVEILDLEGRVLRKGHEAFRTVYGELFQKHPQLHCELVKRMVLGDWVVDEERITGRGPEPLRAVALYEVKGGRIQKVRFLR
jgi:imidazolonepropionase-like amidohydrolase